MKQIKHTLKQDVCVCVCAVMEQSGCCRFEEIISRSRQVIVHRKQLVGHMPSHCVCESVFVCMAHSVAVLLRVCRLLSEWACCMFAH